MNIRFPIPQVLLCLTTALFAGAPPGFSPEPEQVYNGDFTEGADGWNLWGSEVGPWGRNDGEGVKISNQSPKWSGADQIVSLGKGAIEARVSGWMRTDKVVPGNQPWEMARIAVEFLDDAGSLVAGYPPVVGQSSGTTPWVELRHVYQVPKGATKIKIQCALGNATGSVFCDDISAAFKTESGRYLQANKLAGPSDFGTWYDLPGAPANAHFVDWSGLLEAPAGKRGWISPKGEQLVFEDGTPVRFWGVNVVANEVFASHATADSMATRLAKMGANLVRLHHMDAPWSEPNIFGNRAGTRKLDSASLDKLYYLHAALKKRGIYIMPDLLVHREFRSVDGVTNSAPLGGKQVGIFSRKLIELEKEYAKQLFTHVNPYTKLAWKDDPSVALTEFINESTIFTSFEAKGMSDAYRKELDSAWKAVGNKGELASFQLDWAASSRGTLKSDNPAQARKTLEFLSKLEQAYYDTMRATVRSTGARQMLTGTNFPPPVLATLFDQRDQDLVISNDYWDHPQIWKIGDDWNRVDWAPLDNRSQLKNPSANLVATKAWFPLSGKPFLITEWNHCLPNEYEAEAVPFLASYAALQGWNGALQFDFDHQGLGTAPLKRYTLSRTPAMLANWVAAAPIFLRGDVSESKTTIVESIDSNMTFSVPSYSDWLEKRWALPYRVKVRKTFSGVSSGDPDAWDSKALRDSGVATSSTKELELSSKDGVLRIETPLSQGAVGALSDREYSFPGFSFKIANPLASVIAVSADGKPLSESKRFYLVAAGPSRMKGAALTRSRTGVKLLGEMPLQCQVIQGTVLLKGNGASKAKVFPLSTNGRRSTALPISVTAEGATFDLSKAGSPVLEISLESKE